jgi:hypothetical protein
MINLVENNLSYLFLIIFIMMLVYLYLNIKKIVDYNFVLNSRFKRLELYPTYMAMFDKALSDSWDIIFKNSVLPYYSSGFSPEDDMVKKFNKDYIDMVFLHLGDFVLDDLITIHGSVDCLVAKITKSYREKMDEYHVLARNVNETD